MKHRKIGIYTGTFDPIHKGHVEFINAVLRRKVLDTIYIIPEHPMYYKSNVTAYHHRLVMVQHAMSSRPVKVIEMPKEHVSLDAIKKMVNPDDEIFLMLGADVVLTLRTWRKLDKILAAVKFIVGVRDKQDTQRVHVLMNHIGVDEKGYSLIETSAAEYRSSAVRAHEQPFLPEIVEYVQKHRLYRI